MHRVTIREMRVSDWPRMAAIYEEGIAGGIATFTPLVPDYEVWSAAHHECCRLVAEVRGVVAAWAAISPVSAREVYRGVAELSVYVGNEFQGMGVGRKILNALVQASEDAGFWSLRAVIFEENDPSVALHRKCGFRVVGVLERPARTQDGVWHNTVLMERRSGAVG